MKRVVWPSALLALVVAVVVARAPSRSIPGPIGPSPYDVVRGWHKPFAEPGFAFGGNSGVFAESPDRIFVAQRGEFRLPTPVPPEFAGFAGSLKMNVLTLADRRVWQNCLYTLDRNGKVKERWTQWDKLCEGSDGPGPHRLRISPYDPARRVWVINETFHQIYVFSNDGKQLLKTLGEKGVPGSDGTHFAKPQDVAFLPDGRILIADGLDNHRVMIFDKDLHYLAEFGGNGNGPGAVQRRARRGGGPERSHLRARSLRRPRQRVPHHARSEEGGVRRRLARLLAAARSHRQRRRGVDDRPEAAALREARLQRQAALHLDGAARPARRLPRSPHLLGGLGRQPLRRRQPVRPHAEVRAQAGRRSEAAHPRAVASPGEARLATGVDAGRSP